jgi:cobalamin-dependent methionine synthase I
VPIFGVNRLLLVSALALDGYKLVFKNNIAIYIKDNIQYFKSTLLNGIYIVGEEQTRNARSAFINTDDIDDVLAKSATINLTESIAKLWHRRLVYINNNDI